MARRFRIKLPWIFSRFLGLHKPRYVLGAIDLGLGKESNRMLIFWGLIFMMALFFGGIFMITYEFTPPLIETSTGASTIYPGLSRETSAEFILAFVVFFLAAGGAYLIRTAPRREEEAWTSYMYFGFILLLIAIFVLSLTFMYKVGLIR